MEPNPSDDLEMLRVPLSAYQTKTDPVTLARIIKERRAASARLADLMQRFARITVKLTERIDLEHLRVNVYHRVAPELVKLR